MKVPLLPLACTVIFSLPVRAFTSYPNDFVDPNYMLSRGYPGNTGGAQFSILKWADFLAAQGPWSASTQYYIIFSPSS